MAELDETSRLLGNIESSVTEIKADVKDIQLKMNGTIPQVTLNTDFRKSSKKFIAKVVTWAVLGGGGAAGAVAGLAKLLDK